MPLSTGDQGETVRMEDVIFTLSNIVDDISKRYAGSFNNMLLDDCPMEIDTNQLGSQDESQQEIRQVWWQSTAMGFSLPNLSLPTRPDSPTRSEPPMSARSTASSDSEDTLSLYSPSLGYSPASSGFTTPSSSPTSFTFIDDKDTTDLDPVSMYPLVGVDGNLSPVTNSAQTEACNLLEHAPGMDTVPIIKLEPSSDPKLFSWTPNLVIDSNSLTGLDPSSSEQGGIEIIYQTSASSPVFLSTFSDPMPGIRPPHLTMAPPRLPPRPTHPRDSPPHLPALRSPVSPSTPRLNQNEEWDTGLEMKPNEPGAAYLIFRLVDQWINIWNGALTRPPRSVLLENVPKEQWVAEYILDQGNYRVETGIPNGKEVLLTVGTVERRKLKPIVPLWINTSVGHGNESGAECEKSTSEDDVPTLSHEIGSTRGNEDIKQECSPTERDQDTMRLCVKDGKRVSSGPIDALDSDSGPQPKSDNSRSAAAVSIPELAMNDDPNAMRWCVKNGVRVSSRTGNPTANSDAKLADSSSIDAQRLASGGTALTPGNPQNTVSLDQKRPDVECPYVPKKRSPLSRTLLPISSAAMRFQLRTPGDVLNVGKARRKFASMMF
ncbi:unnamed protein product [Rhizoctonia solani]|uniref:Uncharacterized protein n=2 Tax=Rhizoctonia solani TaxID=456999 RepID=A0A8H3DHN9_9AGAM|nr:hypothetical protein RSOL_231420 [Rhizoctonia solani AG-3 Rhs1AP]CAE6463934.1 unnamed protein product [Rhizoctonia solani]CAE6526251.1 unnamed protein product [Rhizoctonia solani]